MDMVHTSINLVAPICVIFLLVLTVPLYFLLKIVSYIKRTLFSENVAGKVVIITGAAMGIGEHIAYEYGRRGALLALVDINEENLGKVSEKAKSFGSPDVISIFGDVSKEEDCQRLISHTINHFGRLDHLVNNAGTLISKKFEDIKKISDHVSVMDVNFWGTVNCTHYALPHLMKTKGKLVVVCSVCGWYPLPKLSIYNASKAALINFCETLRIELGSKIGITIVMPGIIKTTMTQTEDLFQIFVPHKGPEDCARAIVKSACRGDLYLTEPNWCRWLFPMKIMIPQVIDLANRIVFSVH